MFDREFQGGMPIRCLTGKAYRVPRAALVNISHGSRKDHPQQQHSKEKMQSRPRASRPNEDFQKQSSGSRSGDMNFSKILRNSPVKEANMSSAKHVTPPDPKNLPTPLDFFKPKTQRSENPKKKPTQQPEMNMSELWTAVEQTGQPDQNIPLSDTNMNASVQKFFASHQQVKQEQPFPNVVPPNISENANYSDSPNMRAFSLPEPPVQESRGFNANFIPLQVQRSQVGQNRGRGRNQRRGHHQVVLGQQQDYENQAVAVPPHFDQPHRGGGKGRGRGRGRGRGQLAANFSFQT